MEESLQYITTEAQPRIQEQTQTVVSMFQELNNAYLKVHEAIAHSDPICPEEVSYIVELIDTYMAKYREYYPSKVFVKQHILEVHVPQWIERWHMGLGLHGEHGLEHIHAIFNRKAVSYRGIRNRLKRLECIMKDHLVETKPYTFAKDNILEPQPKCRKTLFE